MGLITSSSAFSGPTILLSHTGRTSHTDLDTTAPIHPNTSPNSTSQEVSCFSWWVKMSSIDFMKLMSTILFANKGKYLKCLLLKTKHTNATIKKKKTPLTGWTEIFFRLVDTEKHETLYVSVLGLVSRRLSWYKFAIIIYGWGLWYKHILSLLFGYCFITFKNI